MKRRQTERSLQVAVCQYLTHALPPGCWFTAIPGGNRGMTTTPGYVSGTPDILIVRSLPEPRWQCLYWIELKAAKGRESIHQQNCRHSLEGIGCGVSLCRSVDDVEQTLLGWGITLRATVSRRAA